MRQSRSEIDMDSGNSRIRVLGLGFVQPASRERTDRGESSGKAKAKADHQIIEKLGRERLKILMFYANPPVVGRGEKGLLCYGVSNARRYASNPVWRVWVRR